MEDTFVAYVAVHGGAGVHKRDNDKQVKHALRAACRKALSSHTLGHSVLDIVENAVAELENDPNFNAGRYGSNLTLDGRVECDASIMASTAQSFGSIGAVSGVRNPIRLARSVLEHSRLPSPLGRIPPLTLVGAGALQFSTTHNCPIELVPPEQLISDRAREQWLRWKDVLETQQEVPPSIAEGMDDIQDTVGAVALHSNGQLEAAAGVSSGGLLLKHPGRIGQAAVFGAGCWAQQHKDDRSMACSISGAGEDIMRSCVARELGKAMNSDTQDLDVHESLQRVIVEGFWRPHRERGEENPNIGILMLTTERDEETGKPRVRLWCAFTTSSMAVAYASTLKPEPKAVIIRRPPELGSRSSGDARIYITSLSLD